MASQAPGMEKIHTIDTKEELSSLEDEFASVLSRAFSNDPYYHYIMPDDLKRMDQTRWWMTILLRYTLKYGTIYYTDDHKGIAMWLGPEKPMVDDIKILSMGLIKYLYKVGVKDFFRLLGINGQWDREHKKLGKKHYYLMVIGVEPEFQQRGIGSSLMRAGLKKADDDKLECFLETVTPQDVRFYQKHYFEVLYSSGFGEDSQYWLMKRPKKG